MKLGETLYTQLTDRQLPITKRLDLIEELWSNESKQMIFDWLSGLLINRKKSGLDSIELVHRVWKQLILCLKEKTNEQLTIKPSFIKTLIDTLGNETGEANYSAIECCLLVGSQGKELDYKYEQLVELLRIALTKYQEHEQLIAMILNKYSTAIRVQGNMNKVFVDLCKQLLAPLLNIRSIYSSLSTSIDDIFKCTLFHRTWITAYRDYIQSISTKKAITCSVAPLFTALQSLIISENANVINFLPLVFRHCVNLIDQEKISEIYEFLLQIHSWLDQIKTTNLYIDGIRQILHVLDEKHLIDQLLTESFEEKLTNLMKDILFKRQITSVTLTYANLCVICLHLHPKLIENHLSSLIEILQTSEQYLSIFLIAYIDLFFQMRSLTKLTKRLMTIFPQSILLPSNVLDHYRLCISQCSHTLVDEIWSSLLDENDHHLIIIQLISSLLNGYRLFDLNISREILFEQNQLKSNRTLDRLRLQINASDESTVRQCVLQCYLSLGWFSLCLLTFSSSIPSIDDILNHNGFLLTHSQWSSFQLDSNLESIFFSLTCQRLYRSLVVNEHDIDQQLVDHLWTYSSKIIFEEFEPFFDFLNRSKQLKLMRIFLENFSSNQFTFLTNEYRLHLFVQAILDLNLTDENREKKRKKLDFEQDSQTFYQSLKSKICLVDEKIFSIFSMINFERIQSIDLLIIICWLCLQSKSLLSQQILFDILSTTKIYPNQLVKDIFQYILNYQSSLLTEQILNILSTNSNYQTIIEDKHNEILIEMTNNTDANNLRLLDKYLPLLSSIRSNNFEQILDRLINIYSQSSISFTSIDSRYLLAMIILNSFLSFEKYLKFLKQIWKVLSQETNDIKPIVVAYAKQWENIFEQTYTINDLNVLIKWLDREYVLIERILVNIDENLFENWIEQIVNVEDFQQGLKICQILVHCNLKREKNEYLMKKIHSMFIECGRLLIEITDEHPKYSDIVSTIFNFANEILLTKKLQVHSQLAVSLLQLTLHLSAEIFFENHSNICKLLSLLIKYHTTTLCKHVPTVETILKLLIQSIVQQPNENEKVLEAARDTTKLIAHLIEQCKDDFRSTIVYVLIDYVHCISKGVYLSSQLKKSLHNIAFELFQISGDRIEQYSNQLHIFERELIKQLHQQYEQYHMFKGTV